MTALNPPLHRETRWRHRPFAGAPLALIVALALLSGCSALGKGKLAEQLQQENDRLVAEFRAQRDRNAELQQQNRLLEDRIAETEKLLARQYQAGGSRISSLDSGRLPLGSSRLQGTLPPAVGNRNPAASAEGPSRLDWAPR